MISISAYGAQFTQKSLEGGEIYDGLDVSSVRYGEHSEFIRLVFDVVYWQGYESHLIGKSAKSTGFYKASLSKNNREIILALSGFRAFSASIADLNNMLNQSIVLSRITDEEYADDSTVFLKLVGSSPICYRIFSLKEPSRIVMDIKKCDDIKMLEAE